MLALTLMITIFSGLKMPVEAAPVGEAKVIVESYSVSNDAVKPGEEFELSLVLKNTSDSNSAWDVLVSLDTNTKEIIPVYGTSNQRYIDRIEENKTVTVTFQLQAGLQVENPSSIVTVNLSSYDFYLNELSKSTENSAKIQIPFEVKGTLIVSGYTVPDSATVGTKTRVSATYVNSGLEELNNVSVTISGEGLDKEYKKSLSNIGAGFSNVAEVYLDFQSPGYKTLSMCFQYTDSDGEIRVTDPVSFNVLVQDKEQSGDITVVQEGLGASSKIQIILLCAIVVLGVLGLIMYKSRRSK